MSRTLLLLLTAALTLAMPGCSGRKINPDDPEAAEVKSSDGEIVDTPERALFTTAKRYYEDGLYSLARQSFSSLRDSYPYGPLAEFSQIKIADADFQSRDYAAAAVAYEEALSKYPTSKSAPYSTLMAGRSHQLASSGIGRDMSPLSKALKHYDQFLERFPDSPYAAAAGQYRHEVLRQVAEHERKVLEFYHQQNQTDAYEARRREFEQHWKSLLESETSSPAAETTPEAATKDLEQPTILRADRAGPDSVDATDNSPEEQ